MTVRRLALSEHFSNPHPYRTAKPIRDAIVNKTARYLNEGIYGEDLLNLLKQQFEVRDIKSTIQELKPLLKEQGLQGVYWIDPTVYKDYGNCDEAARLHGTRGVKVAVMGPKCSSCVHHIQQGRCSKLRKALVTEPTYQDRAAQQSAILNSGRSNEVRYADLINSDANMLEEYQLQNPSVEIDEEISTQPFEIEIGSTGKVIV